MIQISIKKQDVVTNQASFPTREEADQWLAYHEGMGSFGQKKQVLKQQVEVSPAVLGEDGEEISPAQFEEQEVELPGYEVEIEDLSAKLEQEKANAEAQKFLDESDWKVLRHRDQLELGLATSLSEEEFRELLRKIQAARERIVR